MLPLPSDILRGQSFRDDISRILSFLQERLGFGVWMFTRKEGDDWIVIRAEDDGYGIADGDVFRWSDSFCSHMVKGDGPCIAPDSSLVENYRNAPIGQAFPIRSYIGTPIKRENGELFGTLCAIDPNPKPESIVDELPLIDMLSNAIGRMVDREMQIQLEKRKHELEASTFEVDLVTGLRNLVAWEQCIQQEELRAQVLTSPAMIVTVRLQESSVDTLVDCASVLQRLTGDRGEVFRIGPSEFGILMPEVHLSLSRNSVLDIQAALHRSKLYSAIGFALRDPKSSLEKTWEKASEKLMADESANFLKQVA